MSRCVGALLSAAALFCSNDAFGREERPVTCTIEGAVIHGRDNCIAALTGPTYTAASAKRALAPKPPIKAPANEPGKSDLLVPVEIIPKPKAMVFLRKSMADLKSLSKPSDVSDATGAVFSWSDDRVERNRNWTAQALVGAGFNSFFLPQGGPYISQRFTGLYYAIDRQLNSKDIKKNVDDMTFGGRHELVLANLASTSHAVGIAGEAVTDSNGATKNWNLSADYQPFGTAPATGDRPLISYANWPFDQVPHVWITFSPKLRAEYRGSLNGSTDPIFRDHTSVLRLGASIGMTVSKNLAEDLLGQVPFLIARSVINVSYGWWYDTLSQRQFSYLDAAYTFNLDEAGNIGITFNYRHGELDTTAQRVDLYKVALSAKFDYDLLTPPK